MKAVKQLDTAPELAVRKIVHAAGYRFRLHVRDLPGKPDVVLPRHRKIIQVQGCFWHGHVGCSRAKLPMNNRDAWGLKVLSNRERDVRVVAQLQALGWDVLTVWECEARNVDELRKRLEQFLKRAGI
jgi:DNA mismatch endonuclease (patch repair protein)